MDLNPKCRRSVTTFSGWRTWLTPTPTRRRTCGPSSTECGDDSAHGEPAARRSGRGVDGSAGFGNTGGGCFERGGPYLVRGAADSDPLHQLLDEYSPEIFCTIRNFHDFGPASAEIYGGNGYSVRAEDGGHRWR